MLLSEIMIQMRECLIILSILILCSATLAKDYANKTHHCCSASSHGSGNVTQAARPLAAKGMPERARRSVSGDRDPRSKFAKALLDTGSKEFLPSRGRRANLQKLREMSSAENPFWAARGRRDPANSQEDPFWAARGKKLLMSSKSSSVEKEDPFWAARGKKLIASKSSSMEKDDPFWAARGKKKLLGEKSLWGSKTSAEDPFWAARGKKLLEASSAENPFWAARGKKEASAEDPFWAARGKKLLEASAENPFWAARGKKEASAEDPFWAARGKKLLEQASAENPFWAARGRRTEKSKEASGSVSKENPFWAARGKRQDPKAELNGVLKPRANRQPTEEFWPARGKRPLTLWPGLRQELEAEEKGEFFTRMMGLGEGGGGIEYDENVADVVAQILGIKTANQKIKKDPGDPNTQQGGSPWYSSDFWATRG